MAVRTDIFAHNLDLTDKVREFINKKVAKLSRFLKNIDEARVDVTYVKSARNSNDRFVAQATIRGRGYILRTEERADEAMIAIDAALDKLQRQIERFKGKRRRDRGDRRTAADVAAMGSEEEAPAVSGIVRRKTFELHPMTEAEALEQMRLLSHDNFFIFFNAETGAINVLYQRRDGTYGLIEPRVG